MSFLEDRQVKGTFFVVGELVEAQPGLIREIAECGHEIGLHGWRHVPLTTLTPSSFKEDTTRGKRLLEDVAGRQVRGFRAPTFSLVAENADWVTSVLSELGFEYSSSVLPARNPLFGYPDAPDQPFRWPGGLIELPAPLTGVGPARVPYLGGVYLRVLPWSVISWTVRRSRAGKLPFIYCHPYDFDTAEEFWVVPGTGRFGSRLLWLNRKAMYERVERLLDRGVGAPLGERLADLPGSDLVFGSRPAPEGPRP
ncbi:MAG: hypothetical protein JJLCMIEE_01321 [Acidimicrobiales bacterium]|nr:hypothetical protein [Acidimicrobiales bacterium]